MIEDLNDFIFSSDEAFFKRAIRIFHFQYQHNELYQRFARSINCNPSTIDAIEKIPFLPISFFKTQEVVTTRFVPQKIFTSSGTGGAVTSQHFVKDLAIYEQSFIKAFEQFYGSIKDYCVLGLLPSYLEREGSSLIYMVGKMMEKSAHELNGFHLYDFEVLAAKLKKLEATSQKTLLIGVTYALLDFAQAFPIPLNNTIIMETGGMKGRKQELLRNEVHERLKKAFEVKNIHSEYGMTELLSQAYALADGLFRTPQWMKILIREEDDPFKLNSSVSNPLTGAINIIDLANIYSCSFIATDDLGRLHPNNEFEVLGRMDNSDIRGCSLLIAS